MYVWEIEGFYASGYVIGVGTIEEILEKVFIEDTERWKRLQTCDYCEYYGAYTDFVFARVTPEEIDAYRATIYAGRGDEKYKDAVRKQTARETVGRGLRRFSTPKEEIAFIRSTLVNGVSPWCQEPTVQENHVVVTDVCD
jgi:hypothetical protein